MAALAYRPHKAARAMRGDRNFSIALLAGNYEQGLDEDDLDFPDYLGEVIAGSAKGCRMAGYHLVLEFLTYGDRAQAEAIARGLLEDLNPDGVILIPPLCDLGWLLDILDEASIPAIRMMPGAMPDRGVCLSVNDYDAAREMTEKLLASGHRDLGFIAGPDDHIAAQARRQGFEDAVAVCAGANAIMGEGNFFLGSGEAEAARLLGLANRPSAIFAANDAMAAGALSAASALGLSVPQDVSIVGFDNSAIARLTTPRLTTIAQPTRELAREAANMLIAAASEGSGPHKSTKRLDCRIVERDSTQSLNEITKN